MSVVSRSKPRAITWPPQLEGKLKATLHGLHETAEGAFRLRRTSDRTRNVANVAAPGRSEEGQANERRECWPTVRIWQAGKLFWPTDANGAAQHALHVIGD